MTLWYISFATDDGFRGGTVVEANDSEHALTVATNRGLNPGGEAAIIEVPPKYEHAPDIQAMMNRLASAEELLAMGGKKHQDCSEDIQDAFERHADVVCEKHNIISRH